MVGGASEKTIVKSIYDRLADNTKQHVINICGETSFSQYLVLISKAELLITIDSGPLHFAISFGTSTISLWGPGEPKHYGPQKDKHIIINSTIYCSPCLYHADFPPCRGDNQCMKIIESHHVLQNVEQILNNGICDPKVINLDFDKTIELSFPNKNSFY